ncbi:MAG: DUF4623 domain-containing protein [Bacteroidales bacterium]|nr:DUF4623 domain-containing protein [Bacteroidales bacterium]
MKKFTLMLAMSCMTAVLAAETPTVTSVWEYTTANSTLPDFFGTGSGCRTVGFGTFESEKVIAVPTRTLTNPAVILLKASDGTEKVRLDMTGVTGGRFVINDAGFTTDGKLLACNMVMTANDVFKVYRWDNSTAAPTVALEYTMTEAHRYGDYLNVTGSITDGTAKIYASSFYVVGGTRNILRFSMIADVNNPGSFKFNPVPEMFPITPTYANGSMSSLAFLPNGTFAYKCPGEQVRKLNASMVATGDTLPVKTASTFTTTPNYVTTVGSSVYLAFYNYGSGAELASIVKIDNDNWLAATYVLSTPSLGTTSNGNGCGRVWADEYAGHLYLYVYGCNNGIAKYEIGGILAGINQTESDDIQVINNDGFITVKGVNPSSIEVYNILGQKIKTQINDNQVAIGDLKGVQIVLVKVDGKLVKTAKVLIN